MKKFTSIFASLILFAFTANATIRTVSNFPANVAQFSSIDAARSASSDGDTILVHGSPNTYGGFTVDRRLIIIGPGFSPNKQLGFTAVVNGMTFSTVASSGTEIQGLTFSGQVNFNSGESVNNISFIRNNFAGIEVNFSCCSGASHNGFLFESNVFDNAFVRADERQSYSNFIFQNNYFYEGAQVRNGNLTGFKNAINILFDHNLFFGPSSGSRNIFVTDQGINRFLNFSNNIFVRRNVANAVSSSTFVNNITFNAGVNDPWSVNGNVNTAGNVENQDPQMVDQAGVDAGTNNALQNFTIAAGPANNAGSDGKDMGLLFDATGSLNWNNSRGARLPFINTMNITTPTVAPGGNVQVNVQAKTNN